MNAHAPVPVDATRLQALNLHGANNGQSLCRVSTAYALLSGRAVRQKVKSRRFKP